MFLVQQYQWETPIAELERYGLELKIIAHLERTCGLYLESVLIKTREQLVAIPMLNEIQVDRLLKAMLLFLEDEEL